MMNRILGVAVAALFVTLLTYRVLDNPGPAREGSTPCAEEWREHVFGDIRLTSVRGTNAAFSGFGPSGSIDGPPIADELARACMFGDPTRGFLVVDRQGRYVNVSGHPDYARTDGYSVFERLALRAGVQPVLALLTLFALLWPWAALRWRNPPETAPWLALIGSMASTWAIVPFVLWL